METPETKRVTRPALVREGCPSGEEKVLRCSVCEAGISECVYRATVHSECHECTKVASLCFECGTCDTCCRSPAFSREKRALVPCEGKCGSMRCDECGVACALGCGKRWCCFCPEVIDEAVACRMCRLYFCQPCISSTERKVHRDASGMFCSLICAEEFIRVPKEKKIQCRLDVESAAERKKAFAKLRSTSKDDDWSKLESITIVPKHVSLSKLNKIQLGS